MEFTTFKIKGMTCDHCVQTITKQFEGKEGISGKEIDYPSGLGKFEFDPDKISKEEIIGTINATGHYSVVGEIETETAAYYEFDLIIIGGGSGAFSAALTASENDAKVLMVNAGLPTGGTCVNVGCVPSKNLIRAAESIYRAGHTPFEGIRLSKPEINFKEIVRQKNALVEQLRQKKYIDIIKNRENVRLVDGWAKFTGKNTIMVNSTDEYRASKFIVATGARTQIPDIEGLEKTGYLTNRELFDLEDQPKSVAVLGAGYIALEIAQTFHRFGTKVILLHRSERILRSQSSDITRELTKHLINEGIEIHVNASIKNISRFDKNSVIITAVENNVEVQYKVEKIVVATGIKANTEDMGLNNVGIELDEKEFIKVNNRQETNVSNIYAVGDCTNTPAFVYTAAAEGKTAALNAFGNNDATTDYKGLPWVVFTDPQVAGAGMDEQEAGEKGIPNETSVVTLSDVPRAIVANDTRGFIKLIRNPETDELLGIRVVAPEGGELVMQASLAIKYGIKTEDIANTLHPYLTLSEGIKLAAIGFRKDVKELSCCAT